MFPARRKVRRCAGMLQQPAPRPGAAKKTPFRVVFNLRCLFLWFRCTVGAVVALVERLRTAKLVTNLLVLDEDVRLPLQC